MNYQCLVITKMLQTKFKIIKKTKNHNYRRNFTVSTEKNHINLTLSFQFLFSLPSRAFLYKYNKSVSLIPLPTSRDFLRFRAACQNELNMYLENQKVVLLMSRQYICAIFRLLFLSVLFQTLR